MPLPCRPRRSARTVAFVLLLSACGGGEKGGTAPPPPPTVATVSVTLAEGSIVAGRSTTATAQARSASGVTIPGKVPTWSSTNAAAATVDAAGTVTGVAPGTAEIVATIDGQVGRATLTVTPVPVATVTVTLASPTVTVGQSTQGSVVLRDAAGATLAGRAVAWSSSNPSIATVNANGLVSGVAVGSATITASSEGRSGTASIAVTAPIALSGLTLQNAAGQPMDSTNVAGRLRVGVDQQVPPGFRGVRTIRLGGTIVAQDSVVAASGLLARQVPVGREFDTAVPVAVVQGDRLSSMPLITNGIKSLEVQLQGSVGTGPSLATSLAGNVTLRNADVVRLYLRPERIRTIDGREVASGATELYAEDLAFSGEALSRLEVVRANAAPTYGAGATSGVVAIITQSGSEIGRRIVVPTSSTAFESPAAGTRFIVRSLTRGSTTWNLGDVPQLGGNAPSVDGSLVYTPPATAALLTLPSGVRYQQTAPVAAGVLPAGFVPAAGPLYFDNLAPRAGALGVAPPSRTTTVGDRAWSANGTVGLSGNYLGVSTDLRAFVTFSAFDDLSGIDAATPLTFHASRNRATLFDAGNVITSVSAIPPGSTPEWYLGVSFSDRVGNRGFYAAKPTAANPASDGTDARFARLATTGTLTGSGVASGWVWGLSNLGSSPPALQLRATGSLFPANAFSGVAWKTGAPATCYIGFGSSCEQGEVLGGTLSQGGTQADFSLLLSTLRSRRAAVEGGSGDGFVSGAYWAADLGGTWTTGPYTAGTPFNVLIDRTAPTASITAAFAMPGMVTATARLADDIGAAWGEVGVRFSLDNSLFAGGQLYAPIDGFPMGGDLASGLSTTASTSWTAPLLSTGRFFDRISGQVTSQAFLSNGAYFRGYDYARNAVNVFEPYANPGPIEPAPSAIQQAFFSVSGASVCNGSGCASGVPATVSAIVDVNSPLSLPPLAKMSFMGIPGDGLVRYFGNDVTPVTTPSGTGFRHRYEVSLALAAQCYPSGFYLLKAMLITADGKQALFPSSFPSLSVVAGAPGTNACHLPTRPLGGGF